MSTSRTVSQTSKGYAKAYDKAYHSSERTSLHNIIFTYIPQEILCAIPGATYNPAVPTPTRPFDEEFLATLVQNFGTGRPSFVACKIVRHHNGANSNTAFALFRDEADASSAVEQLNGLAIGNKRLKISKDRKGEGICITNANVRVKDFPPQWTPEEVAQHIAPDHPVEKLSPVTWDKTDPSIALTFILFSKTTGAEEAVKLHGTTVDAAGKSFTLQVILTRKHAQPNSPSEPTTSIPTQMDDSDTDSDHDSSPFPRDTAY
ncbi:hypothetical protein BV898_12134 [Hypsibius exemplaris]|uniref:RRM domain-containing protein n=1 Tax=Hypsibius exemplaris TaxID=2072580 RepID=A0A1W0WEM4_HYPEX|nr:hypothetical protein BV898_12134 [Hypsibius exemplaris]